MNRLVLLMLFLIQGQEKVMPTRLFLAHGIKGFLWVYNGHGGRKAAEFVVENLHDDIFKMLENCTEKLGKEEAVKAGYLKIDQEFLKQIKGVWVREGRNRGNVRSGS
ncbi:probable protein phosphatase 2C 14 [Actinidia eriantha]|uniref:probable protein phosphatase 2C 14 n=1 Tax=Actinidia eriantha TaxID=165200 RepID=UPI00258E6485|nr:probable protein phosphatase 2C 14 [Actinidia eriantha]